MLFIKRLVKTVLLLFALLIVYLNLKLYYTPACENGINQDVVKQLTYLEHELKYNKAAENMQNIFPEGYLFSNALYGLAWADVLQNADTQSALFKDGCHEIRFSIDQINSLDGKIIFNETLDLPYGAFYKGWSSIREYPNGFQGTGDIDSGPIIWDVGPVASIVGIKAMAENKDFQFYKPLRNCIETLGFPFTFGEKKRYLFGQLFIADAFIAWSNAKACAVTPDDAGWWRWKFHLISLIVLVPFCWWVYRL